MYDDTLDWYNDREVVYCFPTGIFNIFQITSLLLDTNNTPEILTLNSWCNGLIYGLTASDVLRDTYPLSDQGGYLCRASDNAVADQQEHETLSHLRREIVMQW